MNFKKQVDKSHYSLEKYYSKDRWSSLWHQIYDVSEFMPASVLEVGAGLGLLKSALSCLEVPVTVVDIAEDLKPDVLGSVTDLPIKSSSYDVSCAFQVLEHLPFEMFSIALGELKRVSRKGVVISVPNARQVYCSELSLPVLKKIHVWVPRPFFTAKALRMDEEHKWEINRSGLSLDTVISKIEESGFTIKRHYRVPQNPYHHFFVLQH